jgi:hypothetical protein
MPDFKAKGIILRSNKILDRLEKKKALKKLKRIIKKNKLYKFIKPIEKYNYNISI